MRPETMTATAARSLEDDPRVLAYFEHRTDTDPGARAHAAARYAEAHAEEIDRAAGGDQDARTRMRVRLMHALHEPPVSLPLSAIALGFRADPDELAAVAAAAPSQVGPTLRDLPYELYLKTPHWQRTRAAALERAGHACALCPSRDRLQVHHRTYARLGWEDPADLIVLCDPCHARHHTALAEKEA